MCTLLILYTTVSLDVIILPYKTVFFFTKVYPYCSLWYYCVTKLKVWVIYWLCHLKICKSTSHLAGKLFRLLSRYCWTHVFQWLSRLHWILAQATIKAHTSNSWSGIQKINVIFIYNEYLQQIYFKEYMRI